jgi:hypothetical protein
MTPLAVLLAPLLSFGTPAGSHGEPEWLGCWREVRGGQVLWLERERAGWLREGRPTFYRLEVTELGARLESWARYTELVLELEDGQLHARGRDVELVLEPLETVPSALLVEPYELPEAQPLDQGVVSMLVEDLRARRVEDQRVRKDLESQADREAAVKEMVAVDLDNTEFLLGVIRELGWIDATRFGAEAADTAFLIVQHTSDLRLMRTALPRIEEDVRAGRLGGQSFALMHDRLQLNLGGRQRYGSQLGRLPDGGAVLMPCEDLERVDERRASMGMGPLAEYLELFREPDGPPVRTLDELRRDPEDG